MRSYLKILIILLVSKISCIRGYFLFISHFLLLGMEVILVLSVSIILKQSCQIWLAFGCWGIPWDHCFFLKDYFDIVKNPMDLSTIKRKLDTGQYQEPWQYVDDVWLMFNNAWLYNRKTSRVYKFCSKLAEVFEQEIDPVMQSLGYCCGRKVQF